jgi:hypothetical protein
MLVADDVLELVEQVVVIPVVLAEELLQGARGNAGVEGDWLDALLGDIRELSGDVDWQVGAGILTREGRVEPLEKLPEFGLELSELRNIHGDRSLNQYRENRSATNGPSRQNNLAL